ncbi:MAG: hypothetical protein JST85_06155 [Acidobacteria bacterium]|nr:hypothetical protein [Acidobacteriota bacterium]
MQIACNRFSCQKAVEVCYWACKFRRDCKDWHNALAAEPGTDAIAARLKEAAKKSGRAFDPQTMVLTSHSKKKVTNKQAAIVSKSSIAHLKSADFSTARGEAEFSDQGEPIPNNIIINNFGEVKEAMTESNFDTPRTEMTETLAVSETAAPSSGKAAASKAAKPKPAVAKPKPAAQITGPVFLLLYPNGKYKELRESELNTEAADVLKDPSLRLVKGLPLIPQISFKSADE